MSLQELAGTLNIAAPPPRARSLMLPSAQAQNAHICACAQSAFRRVDF